jgi:hypothetical protein
MGFFNPVGQRIGFLEETLTPLPPQVISDTINFMLIESVSGLQYQPAISETISFTLAESETTTT